MKKTAGAHPLHDSCAIAGIGNTAYTRGTERSAVELHLEAGLAAIADAGLQPGEIDAVLPYELAGLTAEDFIVNLGLSGTRFRATVRAGGSSFLRSIQAGCLAIIGGIANHVLLVAGRRGYSEHRVSQSAARPVFGVQPVMRHINEFERPVGNSVAIQWFAQGARRHMHEYGTTSEQLGHVAVACRKHANLNPHAYMYGKPMTLADHQRSRFIAEPLRLLDASLETDGAAAVVITSRERARDLAKPPVSILGIGEGSGEPPTSMTQKKDIAFMEGMAKAAQAAFPIAGLTPADLDCVQIYDCFTWFVLAQMEAIGLCPVGEGGAFVEDGRIELGGVLPLNTHGGLLSEGHTAGANHVVEAVRQIRCEVEPERQVPDCETVLVTSEGNFGEGVVMILGAGR
jgi:acetyl-CoA acetyltransferase